jgi:aldose 1-epimerase
MRFTIDHRHENGWSQVILTDTASGTAATIIPTAGAILNSFSITQAGKPLQVIDGFPDAAAFRDRIEKGFQSAKLSPFVCRIKDAQYAWEGKSYTLHKFSLNGAAIHGLIYDAPFEVMEEVIHKDYSEVELKYIYTGTDSGYPFAYDCYIRYRLEENNTLLVVTAIHNRSKENIPVADGWHPYFTFGGNIQNLQLQVRSSAMLEYDEALIPTGKMLPSQNWLEPTMIGNTRQDHGYVLDLSMPQPLCRLTDPDSGMSIEFHPEKSYPYLQLYTPPHRNSIAIENLSAAPDAFNNGMGLVTLEPDHTRTFSTRYKITKA